MILSALCRDASRCSSVRLDAFNISGLTSRAGHLDGEVAEHLTSMLDLRSGPMRLFACEAIQANRTVVESARNPLSLLERFVRVSAVVTRQGQISERCTQVLCVSSLCAQHVAPLASEALILRQHVFDRVSSRV